MPRKYFPEFAITNNAEVLYCAIRADDGYYDSINCIKSSSCCTYAIERKLKSTGFGKIFAATKIVVLSDTPDVYIRTSEQFAVKVIYRSLLEKSEEFAENPMQEISALHYIKNRSSHPNIVELHECCMDEDNIYSIISFFKDGDLGEFEQLSELQARAMMSQIVDALQHLHRLGISHGDFTAENIVLNISPTGDISYGLIDLGLCQLCSRREEFVDAAEFADLHAGCFCCTVANRTFGKREYMAPELLVGTMFVDEDTDDEDALVNPMLCDLWALGIVLLRVLTGESLISEAVESNVDYQNIVLKGELATVLDDLGLPALSDEVMEIIQGLLRKDPTQRMSLREILSHRWMNP